MNFNFFLVAPSLVQGLVGLTPGPTLSIAWYNHNVINIRFKMPCLVYCPHRKGHSHVSQKLLNIPISTTPIT